jgi:putative ABC transport system permease protein
MSALGTVVRAGVGRRRVQTLVMALTTLLAVSASVLGAGLLVASQAPFDHAFIRQNGAHLTAQFDPAKATAAQIAATAHLPGVTASAGPAQVLSLVGQTVGASTNLPPGLRLPPMTVVGRANQGGTIDALDLTAGRWIARPGEVVLTADDSQGPPISVGAKIGFPNLPGSPTLTVVGLARSVGKSADAWVTPAQLAALTAPGTKPDYQMLYRFTHAATNAQIAADRATIAAAVPSGAMTGAASYLTVKQVADRTTAIFVPFVVAFGVLGLVMSVLVIGIVVSGAVGSATRRIGILKSLGFTPAQIVRAYIGQALIPASVGAVLGVVVGNLLAVPVLAEAETGYGTGTLTVAPWIDVAVPVFVLGAVVVTALVPALRAGRLRTVDAIAVGRTPSAGRGRWIHRQLGRLPLPRPTTLGLASPFSRPARTATMAAAVAFGTIGVTFGLGLALSLNAIQDGLNRRTAGEVTIQGVGPVLGNGGPAVRSIAKPQSGAPPQSGAKPGGSGPEAPPLLADPAVVAAKISAQPGTQKYFSTGYLQVGVVGLSRSAAVTSFTGDSSWGSYQMIEGSWFTGPGQAVVGTGFLNATGTHLGDTVILTNGAARTTVKIVGEGLDLHDDGVTIATDSRSLTSLHTEAEPGSIQFAVDLTPGTSRQKYLAALNQELDPLGAHAQANGGELSSIVVAMDTLAGTLTLMLVAVAGLGVLNTVLLDTRERVHDFGVFKALGMSPRQTVAMVITSVSGIGLLAGAIGVPIGIGVHNLILPIMGDAAGTRFPPADLAVYSLPILVPLFLGGLVIAAVGAMPPAGWAAATRTATALRTE